MKWIVLLRFTGDVLVVSAVLFFAAICWQHQALWWRILGWMVFWIAIGIRDELNSEAKRRKERAKERIFFK